MYTKLLKSAYQHILKSQGHSKRFQDTTKPFVLDKSVISHNGVANLSLVETHV